MKIWLVPVLLLAGLADSDFITYRYAPDSNELFRNREFFTGTPLVDGVAFLGMKALLDLSATQKNVVLSPLNIFSCLEILRLGAKGETKREIDRIIGDSTDGHLVSKILDTLSGTSHASAVFLDQDVIPKQEFVQESFLRYQTEVMNVNFMDASRAASAINNWVAEKTNGTITDIVGQDLDPGSKVVVANALIFHGKWLYPFSPYVTQIGRFEVDDTDFVEVPLMSLQAALPVLRRTNYDVVGLPYKESGMVMNIVLPHERGHAAIKDVLRTMSPTDLKSFTQPRSTTMTLLIMPKFRLDGRVSMRDPLVNQGMVSAFYPGYGNFSNFAENNVDNLFVSDIYHSVFFEVNEQETIASAASAAVFTKSGHYRFKVTRPFIFAITDINGLLLFGGVVTRPEYPLI